MIGFFNSLSDLLSSELVKSYGLTILIAFIICLVISWVIMWFVFTKIIVPSKTIELNNIKAENVILSKKIEKLMSKQKELEEKNHDLNEKLSHFKIQAAIEYDEDEIDHIEALKKFTK